MMGFSAMDNLRMMARYNTLANVRLYEVCGQLPEAELKRVRPAFFKTIHGTLNHILLGDRIWMTRFAGGEVGSTGLDAILYQEYADLHEARIAMDARIEAFFETRDDAFLDGEIRYRNNEGRMLHDPVRLLAAHLFNHQTHHRGQVHDMLTQTDVAPPVLDLHRVIRP